MFGESSLQLCCTIHHNIVVHAEEDDGGGRGYKRVGWCLAYVLSTMDIPIWASWTSIPSTGCQCLSPSSWRLVLNIRMMLLGDICLINVIRMNLNKISFTQIGFLPITCSNFPSFIVLMVFYTFKMVKINKLISGETLCAVVYFYLLCFQQSNFERLSDK